MSEKAEAQAVEVKAAQPHSDRSETLLAPASSPAFETFLGLQRRIGNQAVIRLLSSGAIQPKLRVSQPGDADEVEADRIAQQITTGASGEVLQRKCACGGASPCAKCAGEEDETIHRSAAMPLLRSPQTLIQRFPAETTPGGALDSATDAGRSAAAGAALIVEDDAPAVAPGQMRKSQFMAELRDRVCAAADAALMSHGRSSQSCPYIRQWLAFYSWQDSSHIERALHRYAPESVSAGRAEDYLSIIVDRVLQAVATWASTGQITGVPPGVPLMPGSGELPATTSASSGPSSPPSPPVQAKRRSGGLGVDADAETVRERLGTGRPLDSSTKSRMESAFGHDFSHVRLHTDASAASLSTQLDARAFTLGRDVAFAAGEYQPGTLVGDALMAHELAHVVQQGAAQQSAAPLRKSYGDYGALEADADQSAVGAVAALWTGAKGALAKLAANAGPRLKSGLRLQRCNSRSSSSSPPTSTSTSGPPPPPPPPPPLPAELTITGLSDSGDPKSIFFDRNSSTIDTTQKPKIAPLAGTTPADKARSLTLHGFVSEDETVPASAAKPLADARIGAVDAELHSSGHTGPQTPDPDTTSGIGNKEYRDMRKVRVVATGAPSGVPSCAPVVGGPPAGVVTCSDPGKFTTAQSRAKTVLEHAITKLSATPLHAATAHLLDARFGSTGATRAGIASTVKANLTNLKNHIVTEMDPISAGGTGPGHRCGNQCLCDPNDIAYNQDVDAAARMTLCDMPGTGAFMQEPDVKQRAATLIHEGLHGITLSGAPAGSGAEDFSYAEQRLMGVGVSSGTAFIDPTTALKNNDSYVLFVRALFGETVAVGRPASQADVATGAAMTPAEREQVDRSVAWLEAWLIWSEQGLSNTYNAVNDIVTTSGATWASECCEDEMTALASRFSLTAPPALPTDRDKFAVAAIHERFERMKDVLYNVTPLTLNRVTGATSWSAGPGQTVNIGDDFFAIPSGPGKARAQLDLLLLKIIAATPGITPAQQHDYVTLTDRLRVLHYGGGAP